MNREEYWDRLREFLDQIDKRGIKSLSHSELLEFGRLYRRTSSDLSFNRTHGLDQNVRTYLNNLVGRRLWQSLSCRILQEFFTQFDLELCPCGLSKGNSQGMGLSSDLDRLFCYYNAHRHVGYDARYDVCTCSAPTRDD